MRAPVWEVVEEEGRVEGGKEVRGRKHGKEGRKGKPHIIPYTTPFLIRNSLLTAR
jgi:hypothetical protein